MPAAATRTLRPIRPSSMPWPGTGAWNTSPSAWCARLEDGLQEVLDEVGRRRAPTGTPRKPDQDRAERQDLQRHDHRRRRLVQVVRLLARAAEAAAEGHPVEPEHVEGGERRGRDADRPDVAPVAARAVGRPQDLVLREEAGERRDAGDRDAADEHRQVRLRQLRLAGRPSGACPARPTSRGSPSPSRGRAAP